MKRVVIIGAGASGLSIAYGLAGESEICVTLLESAKSVGGLSKTMEYDGITFDIGPHRFSPQLPEMVKFIHNLIGEDLLKRKNIHGVYYSGGLYKYPPEFSELFRFQTLKHSFYFGASWLWAICADAMARLLRYPRGNSFGEILIRNFGMRFCKKVIFPMIYKVWGTNDLHAEFAQIRFKKPTIGMILLKMLAGNRDDSNSIFYYPKKGYSQIWDAIEAHIKRYGEDIKLGVAISSISATSLKGPFKISYMQDGINKTIDADIIVSTISNRLLIGYLSEGLAGPLAKEKENFPSRTLRLGVLAVRNFHLPARVVIFPERRFIFNRLSEMNQFADLGYKKGESILLADVICDKGSRYDIMTEEEFNNSITDSLLHTGWLKKADIYRQFSVRFPDAYPVLSMERYNAQERINRCFSDTSIILCGREASSDYNNAHNAICKGFSAARYILGEIDFKEYENSSKLIGRLPIQD